MTDRKTYRQALWEVATGQHGFITTEDARDLGVPTRELPKLAEHGAFTHVGYGVYRFEELPPDPHADYFEAVLRVGPGAYLASASVLALHDLASVNPRRIRVGTPRRTRRHLPDQVEVVTEQRPTDELTVYDGIPSVKVARALVECKGAVMTERLVEAAGAARERGLLTRREYDTVRFALAADDE